MVGNIIPSTSNLEEWDNTFFLSGVTKYKLLLEGCVSDIDDGIVDKLVDKAEAAPSKRWLHYKIYVVWQVKLSGVTKLGRMLLFGGPKTASHFDGNASYYYIVTAKTTPVYLMKPRKVRTYSKCADVDAFLFFLFK